MFKFDEVKIVNFESVNALFYGAFFKKDKDY